MRQLPDRAVGEEHFLGVSCRAYLLLVEDVAGDADHIRLFLFGHIDHVAKAVLDIFEPEIDAVLCRSLVVSDVPVGSC